MWRWSARLWNSTTRESRNRTEKCLTFRRPGRGVFCSAWLELSLSRREGVKMVETTRFAIFRFQAGRETPFFRLIMEDGESSDDSVAGRQALSPPAIQANGSWPPDSSGLLQCLKD